MPTSRPPLRPIVCLSVCLAGGLSLAVLSGCGSGNRADAKAQAGPPKTYVETSLVQVREIQPKVIAVGTVLPVKTSVVASASSGIVDKMPVEEGMFVREDAVLSELRMKTTDLDLDKERYILKERQSELELLETGSRPEDVAEAEAKMLQTEALYKTARRRLEQTQQLHQRGARTRDELDEATESTAVAEQTWKAAAEVYNRVKAGPRKEEIEIGRARRDTQQKFVEFLEGEREKRITQAPFDGFVTAKHAEIGQYLGLGDPVVTLANLEQVEVMALVDQFDVKFVRLGDKAKVRVQGNPPIDAEGVIVKIVPGSDWQSGSRGFPVYVRIEDNVSSDADSEAGAPKPLLTEGMITEVTFTGAPITATMIPKDALVRTTSGMEIFLFETEKGKAGEQGLAKKLLVETGLSEGHEIQIIKASPLPGQPPVRLDRETRVVVEGAERLNPLMPIWLRPKNGPPKDANAPPQPGAAPSGK